jgi:prephenate dehydrogenase
VRVTTLAIVGVGLIGGSIGLAARRRHVAARIIGFDQDRTAIQRALERGILDEAAADLLTAVAAADVVVFCTPVDRIAAQVRTAAAACRPGTLLTDTGSTKSAIVRELQGNLPTGVDFIGSHPLAGSEKQGPQSAHADLLERCLVVVTPAETKNDNALSRVAAFWQALGASVRVMSPEDHDRALALTSHLPHLVASALAGVLPPEWAALTATGFRDMTRLASGDPALWAAIFQSNREETLAALGRLEEHLGEFRQALADSDGNALTNLLRQGKRIRDELTS